MIIWKTIATNPPKYLFPDWTLPDNSLNMELYYKDHLYLIENVNIKFSKSSTEILRNVLSP